MERTIGIVPNARNLAWANSQILASDGGSHEVAAAQSSYTAAMAWDDSHETVHRQADQLSPESTSMDIHMDGSSAPVMANSAPSSCAESWGLGNGDRDEIEEDVHWEQGSDDVLTIPKLEPVDDDFNFDDLKSAPITPSVSSGLPPNLQEKQKRPRGRPRKHPLNPVITASKVTKGRSKTGCITCRKRKKKCDEAKPRCMSSYTLTIIPISPFSAPLFTDHHVCRYELREECCRM